VDEALTGQMALVRRLVELGRAARANSGVRTRQPLARALVGARGWDSLPDELRGHIAEELNVSALESLSAAGRELVDYSAKANFRALGRRFGKRTPEVAAAIAAADAGALSVALREGTASVAVGDEVVSLSPEEVVVTETPRSGWAVVREGETVALDLTITPELRRAGLAREVVRLVQEARRAAGLEVTDRIELRWAASDPETAQALREHAGVVAGEVLATSFGEAAEPPVDSSEVREPGLGLTFWLRRRPRLASEQP
jgi:isoleucyl-tRNA synthetase